VGPADDKRPKISDGKGGYPLESQTRYSKKQNYTIKIKYTHPLHKKTSEK